MASASWKKLACGGGRCEENGKYIGVLIFLTVPVLNIEDAGKVLVMY